MTETRITAVLEDKTIGIRPPCYQAPESAHVGWVRLAVSSLERSVEFYSQVIGLRVAGRDARSARLTAQDEARVLIELIEQSGVKALRAPRLGLFHMALLLPNRMDLGAFVQHLAKSGVRFGAGDHIYSEAIYLNDPDGLGVEVYADRPRAGWPVAERKDESGIVYEYAADTIALRLSNLPTAEQWQGAPRGTRLGHVHLSVGDLELAAKFYHHGLGLSAVTWNFPGALFVSAGGYHHHVGMNTWSAGAPGAAHEDARLLYWTLVLPGEVEIARTQESLRQQGFEAFHASLANAELPGLAFQDPWGTVVTLVTEDFVL
jgi:catechol 2,3-dioxygenase